MDTTIKIRPLTIEDALPMTEVLSSEDLYTHIGGNPPTHHELEALYARQTVGHSPDGSEEWLNWIVLEDGERPVGYVQATCPIGRPEANIAWVIGAPWQRRGYATSAVKIMLEQLRARGIEAVSADIHPDNTPSNIVAKRVGLSPTSHVVDGETRWFGHIR